MTARALDVRELSTDEIEAVGGGMRQLVRKGLDWLAGGIVGVAVAEAWDAVSEGPHPQFRDSQMLNNPRPGAF